MSMYATLGKSMFFFFFYAMVYTVIYLIKLIIKCMTDTKLEKSHLVIKWAFNMRHFFSYAVL